MEYSSESSPTKDLSPRWVLTQSCLSPEAVLYHWPVLPPPRVPTLGRPWAWAQSRWEQVAKAAERNCDSHLSGGLRALPCRMSYRVQAFAVACSSMRFTGLNSTGNYCNPAPQHFIILLSSFGLGKQCIGMCGSRAQQLCACIILSSTRPAVNLEAGAGWPPSQNLETSFCAPGVAVEGLELDCALQGACFLRTCWSIITDELPKRKPYIGHGVGSVGRGRGSLMQSPVRRG